MDRRTFLGTLAGCLLAAPLAAEAQETGKVVRIGVLGDRELLATPGVRLVSDAFTLGLQDHGWIENQNFVFLRRFSEGTEDGYARAAAELTALKPDVIVTGLGEPALLALKRATTTIPIVMQVAADPVGTGLAASLARPGGNITGLSLLAPEMGGKRLEALKEAVPRVGRVAVLWNAVYPGKRAEWLNTEAAASALKVRVYSVEIRSSNDLSRALSIISSTHPDAIIAFSDPLTISVVRELAAYSKQQRMPLISEVRIFAEAGALMTYGANLTDLFRRSAGYVDKILKGAKPADLPIEQPTTFELVINLKTAKALGLTIPPSLLARADQIVE